MKHSFGFLASSVAVLALSACGGGGGGGGGAFVPPPAQTQVKVTVDDLPTGGYVVSVGDANAPTVGKYYAAADGSRLLALADGSDDRIRKIYRRAAAGGSWVAVPAPYRDVNVPLLLNNPVPVAPVTLASLAGDYASMVAVGVPATFKLEANGNIVAGSSDCKLSGKVSAGNFPNTLKLSLSSSGCAALPASSEGVLVVDTDDAPANFRLVADNGTQAFDLWSFKE